MMEGAPSGNVGISLPLREQKKENAQVLRRVSVQDFTTTRTQEIFRRVIFQDITDNCKPNGKSYTIDELQL
jgi:hypothetical protein